MIHPRIAALCCFGASLCFSLLFTGCGGCRPNTANSPNTAEQQEEEAKDEKKRKKKKSDKPKEDFTFGRILTQPGEISKDRAEVNYVKRGHWVTAAQQMRANNADVQAELHSLTADTLGVPFDIEHTNYALLYSRPAPLPKGQAKLFESLFFIPREKIETRAPALRNELIPQRGGLPSHPESTPISSLEEWQYLYLVLSSRPSAYNIFNQEKRIHSFVPATDEFNNPGDPPIKYYHLLRPAVDKRVPLPSNPLTWTSIAVILWDDIDPARLDSNQQQALLDWLHWGGHLIVSGPNSLDRLQGSYLEPYLPASSKQSLNLTQQSFAELNEHWSLRRVAKPEVARDLTVVKDIAGVELSLTERGEFLPHTGNLVAAGRVGQGRIVVTAFSMASGALQNWPNFDGFLNGALLMRPARNFKRTEVEGAIGFMTTWARPELEPLRRDARLISNLRYFSRDMGFASGDERRHPYTDLTIVRADPNFSIGGQGTNINSTALEPGPSDDERFAGYLAVPRAGIASWNDFSGVVNVARKHLNDAAGVTIPKADFVLRVLLVYLAVLVPLNWLIFRTLRRVEWAWVAAPVIALVGAITVVRLAQLDIGFVRSRTEIDVVEIQPGYSRAHVSRFIALYTSLATGYDLTFEDATALVQPLAVSNTYTRPPLTNPSQVHFRQDSNLHLSGFKVASNSTGLIHAEQMFDTGGALELIGSETTSWQLKNGGTLLLRDVGILRRSLMGDTFAAYVPEIEPGRTTPLKFEKLLTGQRWISAWDKTSVMRRVEEGAIITGDLRLGRFAELACEQLALPPGGSRLIAWSPKEIVGTTYSPDAAQVKGISFVLAHLQRGPLPAAERDKNVLQDVSFNQSGPNVVNDEDIPDSVP